MSADRIVEAAIGRLFIENALLREQIAALAAPPVQEPATAPATRHDDGPYDGLQPVEPDRENG